MGMIIEVTDQSNKDIHLNWYNYPLNAKSVVVILDVPSEPMDPVLLMAYNIPASAGHLDAQMLPEENPREIQPNRVRVKVFALDALCDFPKDLSKPELMRYMEGHIVANGQAWVDRTKVA